MQNLRDKLLKAGLVTADQAKQAEAAKPKPRPERTEARGEGRPDARGPARPEPRGPMRPDRGGGRPEPRSGGRPDHRGGAPYTAESRIPKLPPLPGSREHQRLVSKKQVEQDRKIRELVTRTQVALEPGENTFYFVTRKQRLRRLELSQAQHQALENGALAIVERPDPGQIEHALIPAEAAEELLKISDKAVRFLNREGTKVGFLSDEDLKVRQDAEASGEAASQEATETQREESEQAAELASEQATDAAAQKSAAEPVAAPPTETASETATGDEPRQG